MSVNLPTHYAQQFSTNVSLLLQQKGSKLRSAVSVGSYVGSQASPVDQIGSISANLISTRFGNMPRTDASLDRRWCFPADYDVNQMIDSYDKLRLITDPSSAYVMNATYALGRAIDDVLISGFFGTNYTGVSGSTSTAFGTNQVVGVNTGGSASNMNVNKLRAAKKILMANEVDLDNDPVYCAITSVEHDALLNEIQVISLDFNDRPVLVGGKVQQFLGINFIHCERLSTATGTDDQSGTSTQIPMWARSGMHLGIWDDISVDVSQRKDVQGLPWQAYAKMTIGATRLEEKKVVKIWCR
jgi:hypothetical protein